MDKKTCKYICIEGVDGIGKTTQTQKLVDHLRSRGYKVLQTKEPGTSHAPLTMLLRGIMLDNKYDSELTVPARELISQAIRSIHVEKVITPAMSQYDFIVQDRGILSGLAYGHACGNSVNMLVTLSEFVTQPARAILNENIYDRIIYLKGNVAEGLKKAMTSKQEFETGDAMESRGSSFLSSVSTNMETMSQAFNTSTVDVDGKDIETVFAEILNALGMEG